MRVCIVGGPGCGKSTLALATAKRMGVIVLCTDTAAQAARSFNPHGVLYAPDSFERDWSGLSAWVAGGWLNRPGPWVMEGVALSRALRKWRSSHPDEAPPCDKLIWCTEPYLELDDGQDRMLVGSNTIMAGLLDSWPELEAVTVSSADLE